MRREGHEAHTGEMINVYRVLMGKVKEITTWKH
jgi:hypothetical protein